MLQSPTSRKLSASVGPSSDPNRLKKLFAAMVILFATLLVVLVRDTQLWFTADPPEVADTWVGPQASSANSSLPSTSTPAPVFAEAPKPAKHVAAKHAPEKPAEAPAVVATNRVPLPPLNIEVVSGNAPRTVHLSNATSAANATMLAPTNAGAAKLTNASEETVAASTVPQSEQTIVAEYPLLARQMKVQGSVLLQALIAADGVIKDLRVISGPAILSVAARQAVLQYRFKPYLQNGHPVETSARVTVNFAIRVLGDQTALHLVKGSTSGGY